MCGHKQMLVSLIGSYLDSYASDKIDDSLSNIETVSDRR